MDVDLDDAGVRGDDEGGQPWVARQRVALDDDRALEFVGHRLDDGQQLDDILGAFERREEHPDVAVARFHRDRGRWTFVTLDDGRRSGREGARGWKVATLLER